MSRRVLLVDDDPHLREVVEYALQREGFVVEVAGDGQRGLDLFAQRGPFDVVVLDVLMPELDGLEVCRRLRRDSRVPIVFLSSRDEEVDKILGLELGGDDYVTKPFSVRELVARVKAVARRLAEPSPVAGAAKLLEVGPLRLDPARHEVSCGGTPVRLTVTEFGVLASLMERPGRVLTRTQLMESAYAYDNLITERTIDTHIKRMRKKFRDAGHDPIETIYGLGYKLRA